MSDPFPPPSLAADASSPFRIVGDDEKAREREEEKEEEKESEEQTPPEPEEHDFSFRGTTAEYFRIWLVNLLLTVATAGIYSAWATVRSRRYFYGNTWLGGANLEYHANPVSILLARLALLGIFTGGAYWAGADAFRNAYYSLGLAFFLPWALVRGLSFNARNSSWADVRFSFARDYKAIYFVFAPLLIFYGALAGYETFYGLVSSDMSGLFIVAVGGAGLFFVLFLPLMIRSYHRYKAGRHRLGDVRFYLHPLPALGYYGALYLPQIGALVFSFAAAVAFGFVFGSGAAEQVGETGNGADNYFFGATVGVFFLFFYMFFFFLTQTALFRIFWSNMRASNGAVFSCDVRLGDFAFRILLVNMFATILSFGLLHPWAKVRKTKYLADRMRVTAPPGELAKLAGKRAEKESALGEELDAAEGFDFDIGLI